MKLFLPIEWLPGLPGLPGVPRYLGYLGYLGFRVTGFRCVACAYVQVTRSPCPSSFGSDL